MTTAMKTLEEHRQYLYDIVRLKLFFMHQYLHRHPDETFRDVLRNRVDIYRKTDFNVGLLNPTVQEVDFTFSSWVELENTLEKLYLDSGESADIFEEEGFKVLKDSLDRRVRRDWVDVSRLDGYQCGSLRYEELPVGKEQEVISFHIANALQPFSMFEDPRYLCSCFAELMRQTERKYHAKALHTGTWLNSLPKWLEYFPAEYHASLTPPDRNVRWHYGYWGQFISARGTYNKKYGDRLRQTGVIPYAHRCGECSFEAMRRHLKLRFDFDC